MSLDHLNVTNKMPIETGWLDGGIITAGSTAQQINIATSEGIIRDNYTDATNPQASIVTGESKTDWTVPTIGSGSFSAIAVDKDGTITAFANTFPSGVDSRKYYVIGLVQHVDFTNINDIVNTSDGSLYGDTEKDFASSVGILNIEGNEIIPNSTSPGESNFKRTAGKVFGLGMNIFNAKDNPNIWTTAASPSNITFAYVFRDGVGGWAFYITTTLIIDRWDDGTGPDGGGLPSGMVTANQWIHHRFYYSVPFTANDVIVLTSQVTGYGNEESALTRMNSESLALPPFIFGFMPRDTYTVKNTTIDLNDPLKTVPTPRGRFDGSAGR